MKLAYKCDYIVFNDEIKNAVNKIMSIITAERHKIKNIINFYSKEILKKEIEIFMFKNKKEGLNYPSIDELLKRIDSKYKLAYLSSKIAHVIEEHKLDVDDIEGNKILSKALSEIVNGNFNITFN